MIKIIGKGASVSSVVDLDLDPHGSAFIFLSLIRIRIKNADPDPGAWKLIQITNTLGFLP